MLNDSARKGSMEKEFANKLKLTASSIDGVNQSAIETSIALTQTLLPSVQMIAGGLQSGAQMLADFSQRHPVLTQNIVMVTTGLVGFRLAWLGVSFVMNQYAAQKAALILLYRSHNAQMVISRGQMLLTGAATRAAAAGQWVLNAAMMANPVGLLVGAIVGAVAILYVLYQNFDSVRNAVDLAWQKFAETFPNAAAVLQGIGDKVSWLAGKFKSLIGLQGESAQMSAGMGSFRMIEGGASVASNATGGIYGKGAFLTTFAEQSAEAAIPLDGSARAVSLWQKAGDMLGVGRGGHTFQLTFAPVVNGSDPATMAAVQQQQDSFFEQARELVHQQSRVSYGS